MPFPPPFSTPPQRINHAPFRPHARRFTVLTAALAAPAPALAQSKHPDMDKCFEQPEAANGVTTAIAKLIAQNPKKATQIKRE